MTSLSQPTKHKLLQVSTATIATCLFKKGLKNQFIQGVQRLQKEHPNMVGEAYTLRYIPAREDLNPISVFKNPNHPQRVAVEQCPKVSVLVFDSRKNARAASAGSILATRLMIRGAAGMVTDGGFRDSEEIAALDLPAYHQAPSAPTNLTLHQAIDINVPIGCGDVAIFPGDVLVGDGDGVIVIPKHLADEVAEECMDMTLYENFVLEQVQKGASVLGLYPLTAADKQAEFKAWKADRN